MLIVYLMSSSKLPFCSFFKIVPAVPSASGSDPVSVALNKIKVPQTFGKENKIKVHAIAIEL
jgi:hypothetical protein